MRKSGFGESVDLSAYPCEWEAEIEYFLRGGQNRQFRVKGIVEEAANNAVEHVRGKTIRVK